MPSCTATATARCTYPNAHTSTACMLVHTHAPTCVHFMSSCRVTVTGHQGSQIVYLEHKLHGSELTSQELSKEVARRWRDMDKAARAPFQAQASAIASTCERNSAILDSRWPFEVCPFACSIFYCPRRILTTLPTQRRGRRHSELLPLPMPTTTPAPTLVPMPMPLRGRVSTVICKRHNKHSHRTHNTNPAVRT